ncbi:hypothetical protein PR048_015063 [Dryococelus australis]|uniref:Uncharacterized protein n=1 Tax=Dryococelus australis TaxID=614101 RepID=A0ABQ9HGV9_9NEOP|nr:hypothetical protein PR048_015063 [Dryococelus australis]
MYITMLTSFHERMNDEASDMYKQRADECFFSTLVNRHLLKDDKKFMEFFCLNVPQFNFVLGLGKEDLKKNSISRVP